MRISDTEANSDDFHNDDFEDFDYSLEEEDMLFSKYIDPSAESFGININQRHEQNYENQDYINEKMQNVEGDSDCVDSDDIESLNGDCDSENEDPYFPKHNPKTDALNLKLELGMIFSNNKEFKEVVIANQAKIGKSIEWIKVDKRKARAKCRKNGCNWRILGSSVRRDTYFQIKTFAPNHTCFGWNYNNKYITSSWIAKRYVDRDRSNKNWKTSEFRDTLRRELRLHVSMHQARREKEKAIAMIGGDINVQFSMLWILQ